ncbi:hypothetical protein [Ralstonia phage RSP15]|uniref:hypothetical protein n=1 Tax=Ralstonia phage RSP15 TaxID=1785960 RepID=UPI00074D2AF7|nr:hypothetical protein BH754_gp164 [Ralstonia phage RSP15]BAU40142.1 hypothetical protein [Ralstonia phage RSP15]
MNTKFQHLNRENIDHTAFFGGVDAELTLAFYEYAKSLGVQWHIHSYEPEYSERIKSGDIFALFVDMDPDTSLLTFSYLCEDAVKRNTEQRYEMFKEFLEDYKIVDYKAITSYSFGIKVELIEIEGKKYNKAEVLEALSKIEPY